jgi:hypothetical protein
VAEADGAACLRPEGWHRAAAAAEVVSSQTVVQSSPASSVLPPVASCGCSSLPGRRPPSKGSTGRSFTCGAAGHLARDCPKAKSSGDLPASLREIQAGKTRATCTDQRSSARAVTFLV